MPPNSHAHMTTSESPDNVDSLTPVIAAPVTFSIENQTLWLIIGGASSGVLLVILLVLTIYTIKRRRNAKAKFGDQKSDVSDQQVENNDMTLTTSVESSVESSVSPTANRRPPLRPSLSMEVGIPFCLRKQNIQPPLALPKWTYLNAPRASIGSLQPDLYRSSDSEEGSAPPTDAGRLWFSLLYNKEDKCFRITLIRAKYLPGRGFNKGVRDPFVKVFLLPDEEHFHQSKVRKRTLSPKFNEIFEFTVQEEEELRKRCLRFSVYDVDSRKVRHCLGHVIEPLAKTDLKSNLPVTRDLEKSPQVFSEGEIQVSLSCNPYINKLKVIICKARNIQGIEEGNVFVFVKVQLFHGNRLFRSKSTASHSAVGTSKSEVIFHEKLIFSVPARFYDSCFLTISICVPGGIQSKEIICGKITIGPFLFARGEQLRHWEEMITNPRNIVTRWHKLNSAI